MYTDAKKVEERIHQKIYQLNPYRQKSNFESYDEAMESYCNCNWVFDYCRCYDNILPYQEWLYWTQSQIQIISQQTSCIRCSNALFISYTRQLKSGNGLRSRMGSWYVLSDEEWYSMGPHWFHIEICNNKSELGGLDDEIRTKKINSDRIQTLYAEYKNAESIDRAEIISKAIILSDQLTTDVAKIICSMLYYL